jgi:alkanesulfonate monooxygenase SsuD/methylene tetrahydromethanopterin reductase-like flavin-dependent oxidoreductase (luciferase family)
VLPLENPLRVVEERTMIDKFPNGRVAIATSSGGQVNGFVVSPHSYQNRHDDMFRKIALIQKLRRREMVSVPNVAGIPTEVGILPVPIQKKPPIWLTGQSDHTLLRADRLGSSVITRGFRSSPRVLRIHPLELKSAASHFRPATAAAITSRSWSISMPTRTARREAIKAIAKPAFVRYLR